MRPPLIPPQPLTLEMSDGYRVFARYWPAPSPRAAILYLHGIQSHGGWFEWSASVLASCGCTVLLPDRRGSGRNDAARGDVPNRQRWLDDVAEQLAWIDSHTRAPREIVGVSWGGKLACSYAARNPRAAGRLLLISPGVFPRVDLPTFAKFAIAVSLFTAPDREFEIPLNDPALFTRNPAGHDFISRDTLKLQRVTARFLYQSRLLDRRLWRGGDGPISQHVTALFSKSDPIIRTQETAAWLRRTCTQTPDVTEFTDSGHTPEFDADAERFDRLLREWAIGIPAGASPGTG
ncbi:Phospholipase YtpA [Phycisphaerae bacterium RAS1]|nr:Phospholipase YtpA [Phycisphaerae bacterium RAS1]